RGGPIAPAVPGSRGRAGVGEGRRRQPPPTPPLPARGGGSGGGGRGEGGTTVRPFPRLRGKAGMGVGSEATHCPPPQPSPASGGVPQQLVPCRRRTSVLRPRPASPCTPRHGRPGATDVQRAPLRRRRLRLTPPEPVTAHARAPSRRPRPPAHRTTP